MTMFRSPDLYMAQLLTQERERLAIKVVNLRRALAAANKLLAEDRRVTINGKPTGVLCHENERPSFAEGRAFWAEVRKVAKGKGH